MSDQKHEKRTLYDMEAEVPFFHAISLNLRVTAEQYGVYHLCEQRAPFSDDLFAAGLQLVVSTLAIWLKFMFTENQDWGRRELANTRSKHTLNVDRPYAWRGRFFPSFHGRPPPGSYKKFDWPKTLKTH